MYKRNDRAETIMNRPVMVPEDQWNGFVFFRFSEKWKVCLCIEYILYIYIFYITRFGSNCLVLHVKFQKMRERNIKNQKKNILPHGCGRKSFARKRRNIVSNLVQFFLVVFVYIGE